MIVVKEICVIYWIIIVCDYCMERCSQETSHLFFFTKIFDQQGSSIKSRMLLDAFSFCALC